MHPSDPPDGKVNTDYNPAAGLIYDAKIALWQGARDKGDTGVIATSGWVSFTLFEIPSVPDFSSDRFPDLQKLDKTQRQKSVGTRQDQFLAALHPLWPYGSVSLRYLCHKTDQGEAKIRLFLIGRVFAASQRDALDWVSKFRELIKGSFPEEYPLIDLMDNDPALAKYVLRSSLNEVRSLVEIVKPEQVVPAWHDPSLCGFSYYYTPIPFSPNDNNMVDFCRALVRDASDHPVIVDVCLVPTTPLTPVEHAEVETWIKICERWGHSQRVKVGGGLFSETSEAEIVADRNAGEMGKTYGELIKRYGVQNTRLFLYSFRVMWSESEPPVGIASSLSSFAIAQSSNGQLIPITRDHRAFDKAMNAVRYGYVTPAVCNERLWSSADAPETLRRLHRIIDIKEAAGFFRLPIPGRDGCPGMALDTGSLRTAKKSTDIKKIDIGCFIDGRSVTAEISSFPLSDLAKHCLIVGTPGSGKTNLCFSLLHQLWADYKIPFIVLEPAKSEYRTLQRLPGMQNDMLAFTVGNERISPFRFNPFEILDGVDVSEHISGLNRSFSGAFNIPDPLPSIIDESIREIYADKGWSEYGVGGEDPALQPPTMQDFYNKALEVIQRKSYRGDTAGNLKGMLETRLSTLLRGPKGRCFNTNRSVPASLLMNRPVVLELDGLNDEEKSLMMMFILNMIRQFSKANRKSGSPLSHVVLVEEAHNVIGRGDGGSSEFKANPKGVAIKFFAGMLAEMRALGEGIIVADQLPTAIAPEAVKNTNIKIMHRMVSADDREELGKSMLIDSGQFQQTASLTPGQSFVFMEGWAKSRLVQEPNFKEDNQIDVSLADTEVSEWMKVFRASEDIREVYLPYRGCRTHCPTCTLKIREQSERWADRCLPKIQKAYATQRTMGLSWLGTAFTECIEGLEVKAGDELPVICAFVHFKEKIAILDAKNRQ